MNLQDFKVRKGDPVYPAVQRILSFQKALRLIPGKGILVSYHPHGVTISARAAVKGFVGSWWVSLAGEGVTIATGFVDGIEPVIDEQPIGGSGATPPKLTLDESEFNESGKSWIAIRAEMDSETGRIIAPKDEPPSVTIVQAKSLLNPVDTLYVHPIAMLMRDDRTGAIFSHQIAFFDFKHFSRRSNGRWRHYFAPA